MNPQLLKKIVLVVIIFVGLPLAIWMGFFRESPDMKAYRENQERSRREQAPAPGQGSTAPVGVAPSAAAPAGQTHFKSSGVDIETLLAEVKEVEFDYTEHRLARNPMTPLIGPAARVTLHETTGAGTNRAALQELQNTVSGMNVMAIVWDTENPYAVINSEVVSRGHRLAEGRIIVEKVQRDRVVLRVGDSEIELKMKEH